MPVDLPPTLGEVWRRTRPPNPEMFAQNNGMAETSGDDEAGHEQSRHILSSLFHRYSVLRIAARIFVAFKPMLL